MSSSDIITIARQTVWVIVKTSVPLLLVSMVVGLIISLFQTLTSFVPKLIAILIGIMVMGTWILNEIVAFMNTLWGSFSQYIS